MTQQSHLGIVTRNEYVSIKDMYKNVHRCFIHNSSKLKTTQMSIKEEWISKLQNSHTIEY